MVYPDSPFSANFDTSVIINLPGSKGEKAIQSEEFKNHIKNILKWICTAPCITSFRVNTLKCSKLQPLEIIRAHILKILDNPDEIKLDFHEVLPNVIIIRNNVQKIKNLHPKEVIVDPDCGAAILRGANIYAPGVIGMLSGCMIGDNVSIYVDLEKKCKKGLQKLYNHQKVFVGNGIIKMDRALLFGENLTPCGVAIEISETISGSILVGENILPKGWVLLQNIPSIVCVHNLNPRVGDAILDMCASPGNKTTHIAQLLGNKGTVVAIDKTPKKVDMLRKRCKEFGADVFIFQADSTKIYEETSNRNASLGPPFGANTFDRILLDAPCSVLGKRPQFSNSISETVLKSYVPLQRKLFETAVKLLKLNGTLVYSTCTITLAENEGLVAWALKKFKDLKLIKPETYYLGGPGWYGTDLTEEQRVSVQRFGPDDGIDSIGFFIACFIKVETQ